MLESLRQGQVLTDAERAVHDKGLVTLLRQHHDAIDALVLKAYSWPTNISDEEILNNIVMLNKQTAANEAKGIVNWLRAEQPVNRQAAVNRTLDLSEVTRDIPVDSAAAWPSSLPEQFTAVQSILVASASPLTPQDVARSFKGKRASSMTPVLEALASIGMARRLRDGKYAA